MVADVATINYQPDLNSLLESANTLGSSYQNSHPFPHLVIDNFFPDSVLESIVNEFPEPGQMEWRQFDNDRERKLGSDTVTGLGENTRSFLAQLNSSEFVKFVEALTGD